MSREPLARRAAVVALLVAAWGTHAQEASVRLSPGPHYAGVPIDVQIVAEGFQESPKPTIEVAAPVGGALDLVGVSPDVSTSVRIVNGRMSQWKSVRFVFHYRLLADRAGAISLGPFRLSQGGFSASVEPVELRIEGVPTSGEQRIRLVLPPEPLWVGQRAKVSLEWWLTERMAERVAGRRAQVPLFERLDRFKFEDDPPADARSALIVSTPSGELELRGTVRREERAGERFLVVAFDRTMIPLTSGEIAVDPSTIVTEEAVSWQRNVFGDRSPTAFRRIRSEDEARTLSVKAPPAAGRPASFSGAVGQGLTIEVAADRTVVFTGDPIGLTIRIRGDAALDNVSLPELEEGGLDPRHFKIVERGAAGRVENGEKRFEVSVRVVDPTVREIPPLELSWFDPERETYERDHSQPIALSVRAASVVSAADVVRLEADPPPAAVAVADDTPPRMPLSGADLSLDADAARLSAEVPRWMAQWPAQLAAHLLALLILAAGLGLRRRAGADPVAARNAEQLAGQRRAIESAATTADLSAALRRMAASAPVVPRAVLDPLLALCDEAVYAPGGGGAPTPAVRERALGVADEMLAAARTSLR